MRVPLGKAVSDAGRLVVGMDATPACAVHVEPPSCDRYTDVVSAGVVVQTITSRVAPEEVTPAGANCSDCGCPLPPLPTPATHGSFTALCHAVPSRGPVNSVPSGATR